MPLSTLLALLASQSLCNIVDGILLDLGFRVYATGGNFKESKPQQLGIGWEDVLIRLALEVHFSTVHSRLANLRDTRTP